MKFFREKLRLLFLKFRVVYLNNLWGYSLSSSVRVSFSAYLDKTYPEGIQIGAYTLVARGAVILSHDFSRGFRSNTKIGCYIAWCDYW